MAYPKDPDDVADQMEEPSQNSAYWQSQVVSITLVGLGNNVVTLIGMIGPSDKYGGAIKPLPLKIQLQLYPPNRPVKSPNQYWDDGDGTYTFKGIGPAILLPAQVVATIGDKKFNPEEAKQITAHYQAANLFNKDEFTKAYLAGSKINQRLDPDDKTYFHFTEEGHDNLIDVLRKHAVADENNTLLGFGDIDDLGN